MEVSVKIDGKSLLYGLGALACLGCAAGVIMQLIDAYNYYVGAQQIRDIASQIADKSAIESKSMADQMQMAMIVMQLQFNPNLLREMEESAALSLIYASALFSVAMTGMRFLRTRWARHKQSRGG